MKTPALVAALVVSFAGSAFAAGEATYDYPQPVTSSVSRADVAAALQAARADGSAAVAEIGWPAEHFTSQRTRAEVRTETLAAGQWRELNRETNAFSVAGTAEAPATLALAR